MSEAAGKARLARNTGYAFLAHFVSFVVPILLTPYILHKVGREAFGVLAVLGTLGLWMGRTDLGIWVALRREVADRRAREDRAGLESLVASWLILDLGVGALLLAALVLAGRSLIPLILPGDAGAGFLSVYVAISVQAVLAPLLRHFMASLEGMQRLDLVNRAALWIAPVSAGALVVLLERGWGIFGVALNGAAFSLLQVLLFAGLLRGTGHPLTLRPSARRPGELVRLLRFGWSLEANQLLLQVFRSDRLLLSATGLRAALVGIYQIGANVAERLGSTVQTLSSGILAAASDLAARGDRDRLRLLLMRSTKYHALAVAGLLGFAALFAPELLLFWLGQPLPEAVAVLRLLAAGSAVYSIVSPSQGLAVALGRPGLVLRSTLAGLAGAAVLYTVLGRRYDYRGLAGSVAAGTILAQVVFMIGFHGVLEFRWREWVGNAFLKPLAVFAPLLSVCGAWRLAAPHLSPVTGRLEAAAVLAPAFLLSTSLAWGLARALKIVDDYDVDVLKSLGRSAPA